MVLRKSGCRTSRGRRGPHQWVFAKYADVADLCVPVEPQMYLPLDRNLAN
jgi:hypothetical protein